MSFTVILGATIVFLSLCGYVIFKLKQANKEIDRLFKANQELQNQKAVAETQVKHFEVRKKHEENSHSARRDDVIERLQQSGDLRD